MFITFEGSEGSGKSTQAIDLYGTLQARGVRVFLNREPGGSSVGAALREVLMHEQTLPGYLQTMLFATSIGYNSIRIRQERQHSVVISDRWYDSTMSLQPIIGTPLAMVQAIYRLAQPERPDLTFLLHVRPEVAIQRLIERADGNYMDHVYGTTENIEHTWMNYRDLILQDMSRWRIIDGNRDRATIGKEIYEVVIAELHKRTDHPASTSANP